MRRSRSLVDIFRRRAASDALSRSADIRSSLIELKVTTEDLDLILDLGQNGEVVRVEENVPGVLKGSEEGQRLLEVEADSFRWLLCGWRHATDLRERLDSWVPITSVEGVVPFGPAPVTIGLMVRVDFERIEAL